MTDRLELAHLWQSVLRTDPRQLFGRNADRLARRPGSGDELPQPGFVGSQHQPGGILFLAKNPGKGTLPLSALEEHHVQALRNLKAADPDSLLGSFETLMESLVQIMSAWDIVRNYVRPVISKADMDLDSIAYLNLLKWRSDDEPTMSMFRRSWQAHTREQLRLLRPAFVIAIGKGTADVFNTVSQSNDTAGITGFKVLERGRSDRQRPPAGTIQLMSKIAEEIRQHSSS
jgi:hypothetical protein